MQTHDRFPPRYPVATGFPAGQTPLRTRLEEIKFAVEEGASEIDVVLDRSLVLGGKWEGWIYNFLW